MRIVLGLATALCLVTAPAFADCADEIKSAIAATLTTGPVSTVGAIAADGKAYRISAEYVPSGDLHLIADQTELGGELTEVTTVGDKGWQKVGDAWQDLPPEAVAEIKTNFANGSSIENLAGLADAQCLGEVELDGKKLLHYSFTNTAEGDVAAQKLWVDPANGAAVRQDMEMSGGAVTGSFTYTYDPNVTVTAPM